VFISELFAALESAGIEYAVVGGVAVNIHGIPRMTYDVDIVVATSEPSLRACREVLEGLGLRSRLPSKRLRQPQLVRRWRRTATSLR